MRRHAIYDFHTVSDRLIYVPDAGVPQSSDRLIYVPDAGVPQS